MFFSDINQNLNQEHLTKDGQGLRMDNFNIMGVNWKI